MTVKKTNSSLDNFFSQRTMLYSHLVIQMFASSISACSAVFCKTVTVWIALLNLHPVITFTRKQKMRRSQNKEEQKRILMDLEVVMKCHSCPFIVNCLGSYISRVSPLLLLLKVTDFCSFIIFVSCFKTGCFFGVILSLKLQPYQNAASGFCFCGKKCYFWYLI